MDLPKVKENYPPKQETTGIQNTGYARWSSRVTVIPSASDLHENFEIRFINENIGRGLFAKKDFGADLRIFEEAPLAAIQSFESKIDTVTCAHCFRFVSTLSKQLQKFIVDDEEDEVNVNPKTETLDKAVPSAKTTAVPSSLPFEKDLYTAVIDPVPCLGKCDEVYCSEKCRQANWEKYHKKICPGNDPHHLWNQFQVHAVQNNDEFRLAAQIMIELIVEIENGVPFEEAWNKYDNLQKALWWKVSAVPEEEEEDEISWQEHREDQCIDSLSLLQKCLPQEAVKFKKIFDLEFYSKILGMIEMNSIQIVIESPVQSFFDKFDQLVEKQDQKSELSEDFQIVKRIRDKLDHTTTPCEHESESENSSQNRFLFPIAQGTGIFPVIAMINHSCDPNVFIFKTPEDFDNRAVLITKKEIKKGEQLFISYIDEEQDKEDRQALLRKPYLFQCACSLCLHEK